MKMGKIVTILSCVGLGFLMAITVASTNPELDIQDRYLIWAVVGLSVVALLAALFAKRISRFSAIDGMVLLFFLYLLINYQLISPVDASAKWLQTVYLVILYGALRIILPSSNRMEQLLIAAVVFCGLWESVLGLMQIMGFSASHHHLFAFTGTYVNTGPYGGFLAITMSIALGFMIKQCQKFIRQCKLIKRFPLAILKNSDFALYLLSSLSFCCSFTIFFAAMSRAAILGLLISVFAIIVTQPYAKRLLSYFFARNRRKKIIMFTAAVTLLFLGLGATYCLKKESANGRVLIWKVSCQVMVKQPLWGSGFGSFFGSYSVQSAEYFRKHPLSPAIPIAGVPEYSFNEYLQTGVETGIVGLLLLLSILFGALYRLLKTKSVFAYGLIVMMVFAFFSYPFSQLPFQILLILFVAAGAGARKEKEKLSLLAQRIVNILFCVVLIIISWGLSGMYQEKIKATMAWEQVRMLYNMQHYFEAVKESAELYPLLKDNSRFLFEYGHALNKAGCFAQSNAILREGVQLSSDPMFYNIMGNNYKGVGDYVRAEESYQYTFDILPNRLYPLYLLMKLYAETDQIEKATEMAQRIIDFPPKIDSPAIRDMKREAKEFFR